MGQKKIPLRTCVVTKEKLPKQQLVRIVRTSDGAVALDESGKQNGRGAYIKLDASTVRKARKAKKLERHLHVAIPDHIYEALERLVDDGAAKDT